LNFAERLHHVTVLDPACGSGNFLYVAINLLLDLEKEVISFAASHGLSMIPHVRPTQLAGIEINPYAQELASVVIWIGYLQWMHHNGFRMPTDPVLEPIETIRSMDAILDLSDPENPREPEWPEAEFIVGNPPFLGNKRMRSELSEAYVKPLWALFGDRIPATSDLCCYWFEKALATIQRGATRHAGLLATTTISQVSTRRVLERITDTSRIFFAVSDREWILDGAAVRIALIGFGRTAGDAAAQLDGKQVPRINPDLTAGPDITRRNRLTENVGLCFMGVTKVGDFDIDHDLALQFMQQPNVNGRPNSDVLRPFRNGSDIVRTCSDRWVIDFGVGTSEGNAAQYQGPFEHVVKQVKPQRAHNGREAYRERWWIHGEARPGFRHAVAGQVRYVGTARVAEHRLFVWLDSLILPDSKVIAITLSRDSALGMLHSRVHEVWTNATCGLHGGERRTYNPTTCFETFPMPEPTPEQEAAIAEAAKQLDDLRNRWLNPPEWTKAEVLEFPGSGDGPWARYVLSPDKHRIGTVRWPRVVPKDPDCAESLKQRTLTNLYNERPAWLDLAHKRLDEAVFAAYGWNAGMGDERLLEKLLELNLARAGGETG
jgi:type II restriction/modification system DNA methylase subunit YeeA